MFSALMILGLALQAEPTFDEIEAKQMNSWEERMDQRLAEFDKENQASQPKEVRYPRGQPKPTPLSEKAIALLNEIFEN